jgi:hypothetical protein
MAIMLRGNTKHSLNLKDSSTTLLHMKTSKAASFTMGQKCPDLWHAICSLELEHDV